MKAYFEGKDCPDENEMLLQEMGCFLGRIVYTDSDIPNFKEATVIAYMIFKGDNLQVYCSDEKGFHGFLVKKSDVICLHSLHPMKYIFSEESHGWVRPMIEDNN